VSLINSISEEFILPLGDLFTGQSVHKHLKFLFKSQYWSREQIDSWQNERLRLLIHHAYSNVPFYAELFKDLKLKPEDIQTKEDLQKFPIITKDDLKRKKDKHLAVNLDKQKLLYRSSSGSTGEPFQFYTTKHAESFSLASAIRSWNWMGYRFGDRYVKVSMNPRSSFLKKIQDWLNNSLYLSATQLSDTEFRRIEKLMNNYDPKFIRCYPVPLFYLARSIKSNTEKYLGNSLIAINTTGSTLHDDVRREIEDVFNVKIFDAYSCEGGAVFAECPTHEYYHPAEEYAISEFIEDNFTRSDKDKPVRHITTDLQNYASPFIRYDTQDYVVLGDKKQCTCGRHLLNVKKIKGRDSDILVTPLGKYLIVENFVAYFEWIAAVDQIQVIQEEMNRIVIKMIVNDHFDKSVLQAIQNYWDDYIGSDVAVILQVVDEIMLTSTGKRRTVIRNPKIHLNA
jgi:phenylacetate-CoA ligase